MSQFTLDPNPAGKQSARLNVSKSSLRFALTKSFLWMAFGLLLTMAAASITELGGFVSRLESSPWLLLIAFGIQLLLVVAISRQMSAAGSAGLKVMFAAYSILTGITLSTVFAAYSDSDIWIAFGVSMLFYVCLALTGLTTKIDFTKIGMTALVGVMVLLLAFVLMSLFGLPMSVRLFSSLGLILFTGITIWDMQRMARILQMEDGSVVSQDKWSVYFALQLYLDFINIFLYILRLISIGSGSSRD